jgi:hypothetical protein
MDTRCPECGSHAARLLEISAAGGNVYGCLGCGAVIPPPSPRRLPKRSRTEGILHDRWVLPHQVRNSESEAAKISRLRTLRLRATLGMPAR